MRLLPTWLRGYDRAWLPVDVMAGLTVWALMVPQALAYAGIAGVPVQNGLYVMPLAVVGYLLLGSSRHLYVGPSATVATLSASTVALVATASTGSGDYIALTVALTLMVGVIYIAGGLARMGFVSRFFAPASGIDEDPVTGSAHSCLAHFWSSRLQKDRFMARQLSERGGLLKVQLDGDRVRLSGQAVTVFRGELLA